MYKLLNAKKQNQKHPDSFEVPSKTEVTGIKIGDYVKLCFEETGRTSERMWVLVNEIGESFVGELHNQPFNLTTVKHSDKVLFESKNVLSIMKAEG